MGQSIAAAATSIKFLRRNITERWVVADLDHSAAECQLVTRSQAGVDLDKSGGAIRHSSCIRAEPDRYDAKCDALSYVGAHT